jgi:hypothetical protein
MCPGSTAYGLISRGCRWGKPSWWHPPYWQDAVKLELCALRVQHTEATIITLKVAVRTTVLLVDDDIRYQGSYLPCHCTGIVEESTVWSV